VDRAHEPGDVEAPRELDEPRAPGHQDKPAIPRGLELIPGHHLRPRRAGVLYHRLAVGGFSEDQEATVAQRDNGRQGRLLQPFPARRYQPRLDLELLRAAQHLGGADRSRTDLVTDLLRIGRNAQESQQHHERGQSGIGSRGRRPPWRSGLFGDALVDAHAHPNTDVAFEGRITSPLSRWPLSQAENTNKSGTCVTGT